ncbi:MAG: hypothetical protein ACAI35_12030 [Candidatus Methylacidiphilales bacterium]
MKFKPPGECPVCGENVSKAAKACRHCGADELTGWDDKVDLEDEFRYDEFIEDEFGDEKKKHTISTGWRITAAALVLISVLSLYYYARTAF